jgi:pre-mRNA-processing factor 39
MYEEDYENSSKEIELRKKYETAIKRPYFHTQALDDPQLENWREYLDFEEKLGDFDKVVQLYNRCLIPCVNKNLKKALYFEFWKRFCKYLEANNKIEEARHILERAARVYVSISLKQVKNETRTNNIFGRI